MPGIKHTTQATGTNDAGKQVSKDVWNEFHTLDTLLNFPPQASDPASPVNGDVWATTAGQLKAKLNGTVAALAIAATTLAGYGITDAVALSGNQTVAGIKSFSDQIVLDNTTTDPVGNSEGSIWHDSRIHKPKMTVGTRTRSLQTSLADSSLILALPLANAATLVLVGVGAQTATGTATATGQSTTSLYTRKRMLEYLVTAAATTAVAGFRSGSTYFTVGGGSADVGGFRLACEWGPSTGVATTTNRAFCGVTSATAAPTDVEPSTNLVNCIGMGWDAADANVQIMHNDATGTCTKIDLGSNFAVPTTDRTQLYRLELYSPKGTTQSVEYRVTNLNTGNVATGSITTNLPTTTTMLGYRGWVSVGGTSSVIGLAFCGLEIDILDGLTL